MPPPAPPFVGARGRAGRASPSIRLSVLRPCSCETRATMASTSVPWLRSRASPTPEMACSPSSVVGRTRLMSRRVASWKIVYGGTPLAASSRRQARRASNSWLSTPSHDTSSALRLPRAGAPPRHRVSRTARCPRSTCHESSFSRSTGYWSAVWSSSPADELVDPVPDLPVAVLRGAGRMCSACRGRASAIRSRSSSPRSTPATWPTPNRSPTRATHERIFWATTVESGTNSTSPRHTSHAPQCAASNGWPKYSTSARCRHTAPGVGGPSARPGARERRQQSLIDSPLLGRTSAAMCFHVTTSPAGVEQHALGLQAVAAGPAGLLLVVLDRLGHRRRAARSGCSSGRCPCRRRPSRRRRRTSLGGERVLRCVALLGRQAGVVRAAALTPRCASARRPASSTSLRRMQ